MSSPEMGSSDSVALSAHYQNLESQFRVSKNSNYERLVTAAGNSQTPVHRWFHIKEAYSHALLARVAKDAELDQDNSLLRIYDPFSGSGTTLASAGDLAREQPEREVIAQASEVNPFLHLLSSVKLTAYDRGPKNLLQTAKRVAARATRSQVTQLAPPALSTFRNTDYFPSESLKSLLRLRAAIESEYEAGVDPRVIAALRVCLAAAIEPASRLRKDGRALRFEPAKCLSNPVITFLDHAHDMVDDWRPTDNFSGSVALSDARLEPCRTEADLILFSPPYPNNIDYSEVYKLEAWLLGFITSQEEFTSQRWRTVRSHPSIRLSQKYSYKSSRLATFVEELIEPICAAVSTSRYSNDLKRTIRGYTDDMLRVLEGSFDHSSSADRRLVFVVGNSQHGQGPNRIVIAADLIIAQLASALGFQIDGIEVARTPARRGRGEPYLRESVVFARKSR